jgi:tetratricopeptide (TPR) repeat protein
MKLMVQGKEYLRKEKYEEAEKTFKKIFSIKETLPDELCFYYGVTLVKLKKYVKAREFLEKYQSLTNSKGEFEAETKVLLAEIDKNVCKICKGNDYFWEEDSCGFCNGTGFTLDDCHACRGKDRVVCPTCKGSKVLVSSNGLGTWYNDCPRCEDGTVTCMRCKGSKQEQHSCGKCHGKGKIKVRKTCTHL